MNLAKSRNMKAEEFLLVMEQNKGEWPEFDKLQDEQKRLLANLNICSGTAETFFDDNGEIYGVGGIRYIGLGEAWFITKPENRKPVLLRTAIDVFRRIREDEGLWRIFASSRISENFLRHSGFQKDDTIFTWTRT